MLLDAVTLMTLERNGEEEEEEEEERRIIS